MPRTPRVLVVDDDRVTRQLLEEILAKEGYATDSADSGEAAVEKVKQSKDYDLVISDIRMGGKSGLDLLREIRASGAETEIILITGFGSMETAMEAVREGAFDYVSKPFKIDEIKLAAKRAIHQRQLLRSGNLDQVSQVSAGPGRIVGRSRPMIEVFKLVAKVAANRSNVLIVGESGTGKELIAHAIHAESPRREKPFVAVNCAAIPEALLESELFGHVRGSFTTAVADKPGLFEEANGGTLFLDEVGDLATPLQAKLLRAIESGETKRVGSNNTSKVDVRIIAATNKSLPEMVKEGTFREDLYFRLNVVTIETPPLRDRKDDIPLLAEHFLAIQAQVNQKRVLGIAPETLSLLVDYPWPGNVRELAHVIERAVALSGKPLLLPDDLPPYLMAEPGKKLRSLEEVERDYILEVLKETRGNKGAAAEILHIDRKTLQRKMQAYKITLESERDDSPRAEPAP
ncbi:MAG TPA: sigma-54 dependent transcriptional regulator [Planctomycetota bacterium]|nr:sigma-54 dependent transcriptional regulator [Planctomycetota bacterium]